MHSTQCRKRTKLRSGINPTTRKDVQLRKRPEANDVIRARLHQTCHAHSPYRVFKGLAKLIKKGSPSPRSNGRRLTSKSALADFEVGEVRQVRRFRVSRRWNRCNDPHDSSGVSSSVPQSRRSVSTSEAVKQSQRRPFFIQHQFRL